MFGPVKSIISIFATVISNIAGRLFNIRLLLSGRLSLLMAKTSLTCVQTNWPLGRNRLGRERTMWQIAFHFFCSSSGTFPGHRQQRQCQQQTGLQKTYGVCCKRRATGLWETKVSVSPAGFRECRHFVDTIVVNKTVEGSLSSHGQYTPLPGHKSNVIRLDKVATALLTHKADTRKMHDLEISDQYN